LDQPLTIVLVMAAAYVAAYPAFALTYSDIRHYPRHLWTGVGNPHSWRRATVVTYLLLGLPVIATAVAWWTSTTRAELRNLAHGMEHDANH
jgi:hypothetical protein